MAPRAGGRLKRVASAPCCERSSGARHERRAGRAGRRHEGMARPMARRARSESLQDARSEARRPGVRCRDPSAAAAGGARTHGRRPDIAGRLWTGVAGGLRRSEPRASDPADLRVAVGPARPAEHRRLRAAPAASRRPRPLPRPAPARGPLARQREEGRRDAAGSPAARRGVGAHRAEPETFVFAGESSAGTLPAGQWNRWTQGTFRAAKLAVGLPNARAYDLRHSFVSLLIHEGQSILEVARQAGHSPQTCLRDYGHLFDEFDPSEREPAEAVIAAARGSSYLSRTSRRTRTGAKPLAERMPLKRDIPEREPAGHVLFPWQLGSKLGLDAQLALGVAGLLALRGHERVIGAALEVVDEVERLAVLLEGEHGGEHAVAVAGALELARDGVDRHHEVVEVLVLEHEPAVAVLVVVRLDLGAGVFGRAGQQLLGLLHDLLEVGGAERLEDDPRAAAVLEAKARIERD